MTMFFAMNLGFAWGAVAAGGDVIFGDLHDIHVANVGVNTAAGMNGILES